MVLLISPLKAQRALAKSISTRRLLMDLTQENLAERSGVALSTLRKFEQKGLISLESFLKLLLIVGGLEELMEAIKPTKPTFSSIDEVLKGDRSVRRKRGGKK